MILLYEVPYQVTDIAAMIYELSKREVGEEESKEELIDVSLTEPNLML